MLKAHARISEIRTVISCRQHISLKNYCGYPRYTYKGYLIFFCTENLATQIQMMNMPIVEKL